MNPLYTILVVDDNPAGLYITKRILSQAGYQVLGAENGDEMRKKIIDNPDVIVLDINLPDIDGYTLCKEVKENIQTRFTPVIHLSALSTDDNSHIQGIQSGSDAFLTQPVDPKLLIITIESLIQVRDAKIALWKSEEKYRQIVELAQEGIWVIDPTGITTYVNPRMAEMLGYSVDEMIGSSLFTYLNENEKTLAREKFESGRCGRPVTQEFTLKTKSGKDVSTLLTSSPITGDDGICKGSIAMISDISEQKWAMNALKRANHQLSVLSAITRHDILNELMVILGSIDLLANPEKQDSHEKYIKGIEHTACNIRKMIEFTQEFETLGTKEPKWQRVLPIIRSVYTMLRSDASISLVIQVEEHQEIYADPLFPKVIYFLMENSIRHGIRASEIRISSFVDDAGCHLVCEDNGIGIPDGDKENIFEKGYGENTGLGLFFASEILSVTNFMIQEKGVSGSGARFDILVPPGKFREANDDER